MGVYIKGMEMPVTCCHCPLMGYDPYIEWVDGGRGTQGAYICVITHELIGNTKREEHCPLVSVPPHGRLIDGDEFLKNAQLQRCFRGDYALLLNDVIEECATIIPAEEGE